MKRTKELFFREHPKNWQEREGVSGLREFDGEDLCNYNNTKTIFKSYRNNYINFPFISLINRNDCQF
jgi:hypothetical protein